MSISYKRHLNNDENDRVEFLMINFDYIDGNDLLAKYFNEVYGMVAETKLDGGYYSVIKLHLENTEYDLVWHEDIGNYLYSIQQDNATIDLLENRLKCIITKINEQLID